MARLTHQQLLAIEVCTRTMSVLSLLGSSFIISTFMSFPIFRRPINRLVFYATFGNILANVATLISTSGIPSDPQQRSSLCEFQGVLIQWFMMADSFWVFCMAVNVFLVFWYGYDAQQLRYLEKWYFLFAYGVPAIPPIIYIILDHHSRTRIFGPATLWCWIAKDVDWMRISFFYGPVWIVVSATLTIYIVTGMKIFKQRALLRFFMRESKSTAGQRKSAVFEETVPKSSAADKGIRVTTQIHHDIQPQVRDSSCALMEIDKASLSSSSRTRNLSNTSPREESTEGIKIPRTSRDHKTSMDFRESLHQNDGDVQTGYRATAFASNHPEESTSLPPRPPSAMHNHRPVVGNAAAWAYLKVAFLMFIALFVVWVPSTVNRLYQFIHKDQPSYALNIISAIVLPLQGAWNATIYIYTTRSECKRAHGLIISKLTGRAPRYRQSKDLYRKDTLTGSRGTSDSDPEIQLEEVTRQGEESRHAEWCSHDGRLSNKVDHNQEVW